MTPFEAAGYTKDTKFRVLRHMWYLRIGDIVTLYENKGRVCPWFKTEDGRKEWVCLPDMAPKGCREYLEVYES